MDIEKTIEHLEKRLKDYCWFSCIGEGANEMIIIYVKNSSLYEKRIVTKIMEDYTDNYEVIKLAAYSPGGGRNV
ncbi:MAG TPA: hypothetical protein VMX17_04745 [Candidatus Glassbacteria bacterium]|nr:hypothetical protein [Candidatus Glassbacteria bacterium]